MEITEVRIKLVEKSSERLRAFCSITLDGDFVIRDLKIIDGTNGIFVAMPSRKLMDRCPRCGAKNHLRARFCNECGARLTEDRAPRDAQGRGKLHADVAHPINAACRERLQKAVVQAYLAELEKAKSPDYRPARLDDYDDYDEYDDPTSEAVAETAGPPAGKTPAPSSVAEYGRSERTAPAGHQGSFSDYDDLIADLRREAAGRHRSHQPPRGRNPEGTGESRRMDRDNIRATFPSEEEKARPAPPPGGARSAPSAPPRADRMATTAEEAAGEDFGAGL